MDVANLLLRITGDNNDAKRALREVAAEMREFASKEAQAHIKVAGYAEAKIELDRLETALTLIGQRDVTARVKVKVDRDRATLSNLRSELEHALAGGGGARPLEHIFGDIERLGGDVGRLGGEFASTGARAAGFFASIGEGFTSAIQGAGQLGGKLLSSVVGGFASLVSTGAAWLFIAAALFPVISALAGVLVGLVGSLGAAALGFGALAVGFGGVLVPGLLLGLGVLAKVTGAFKALGQEQQNAQQTQDQIRSATEQHTVALQNQKDAAEQLGQATTDAYRAWDDAIEAVKDDLLAVEHAELGVQEAHLRLDEATNALKNFREQAGAGSAGLDDLFKKFTDARFHGDPAKMLAERGVQLSADDSLRLRQLIIDVKAAKLGEKDANDSLHDTHVKLIRDRQTEADFTNKQIKAYGPYVSALKQVAAADRAAADTARALNTARGQSDSKLSSYSAKEIEAAKKLRDLWKEIQGALAHVETPVLVALEHFFSALGDFFSSSTVRSGFEELATGIADMIGQWATFVANPDNRTIFADLARDGGKLAKVLGGRVMTDFLGIMIKIAHVAAPELIKLFRRFADWLDSLDDSNKKSKKFNDRIQGWITSFKDWFGVITSLGSLLAAFFGAGKTEGDNMAKSIKRQLDHWTHIINQEGGRQKIIDWIHHSAHYIKTELVPEIDKAWHIFKKIIDAIQWMLDRAKDIKNAASWILSPPKPGELIPKSAKDAGPIKLIKKGVHWFFQPPDFGSLVGKAWGGPIPGVGGFGDGVPMLAEGGEYMIRRSVVEGLGRGALDALNAGMPLQQVAVAGGGRGGGWNGDAPIHITLQTPGGSLPDGRFVAAQIGELLRQRGRG